MAWQDILLIGTFIATVIVPAVCGIGRFYLWWRFARQWGNADTNMRRRLLDGHIHGRAVGRGDQQDRYSAMDWVSLPDYAKQYVRMNIKILNKKPTRKP